jgi:hypothetical protein
MIWSIFAGIALVFVAYYIFLDSKYSYKKDAINSSCYQGIVAIFTFIVWIVLLLAGLIDFFS